MSAPDAHDELSRVFSELKAHFQAVAERYPHCLSCASIPGIIEEYESLPGRFAVAEDGTLESTFDLSAKNRNAYGVAAGIMVFKRANDVLDMDYRDAVAKADPLIARMNDLLNFPTLADLRQKELQKAARELAEAARPGLPSALAPAPAPKPVPPARRSPGERKLK